MVGRTDKIWRKFLYIKASGVSKSYKLIKMPLCEVTHVSKNLTPRDKTMFYIFFSPGKSPVNHYQICVDMLK